MKRSQLIDALAARFEGNRKAASQALDAVVDTITREVARGERVVIKGFGTFERVLPMKGTGVGTRGKQPGRRSFVPEFVPGKDLIGAVAGKLPLPKVPRPVKRVATGEGAQASTPEVPADVAPVEPTAAREPTAAEATASKQTAAKKTPAAKSSTAKSSTAKKSTAKKSTAKKSTAKKSTAKKSTTKKSPVRKAAAKSATKKTAARKTATDQTSSGESSQKPTDS